MLLRLCCNNKITVPTKKQLICEKLSHDQYQQGWYLNYYSCAKLAEKELGSVTWNHLLKPKEVHLIFNLQGQAVIMGQRIRLGLASSTLAMCCPNNEATATRVADGSSHEFVILSMQRSWLSEKLGNGKESIYPAIWNAICGSTEDRNMGKPLGKIRSMTIAEKDMARQLTDPPVESAAIPFWYSAKVVEILALHMFVSDRNAVSEPFCIGQKRVNRERVDVVIEWLGQHLEEPLDLKLLAQHVGCAPHYLSRIFSKEVGRTISQYLRALRIERAAMLMDNGRHNVTEAAFEVGYNSMSHFTKAFLMEKGINPSNYLARTA